MCRPLKAVFPLPASALVGGVPKTSQLEELEVKRPAIVVGTPGRLADLAAAGELQLGRVEVVVLDEADKMMQMGFADQLAALRGHFPTAPPPQTLLFSATFPRALAAACDEWLAEPVRIDVTAAANASDGSGGGGGLQIGAGVTQEVAVCAEHKKPRRLLKHLAAVQEGSVGQRHEARVLIFANKIKTVRFLHGLLKKHDVRCLMLHGLRSQAERRAALQSFKSGKVPVLVATDVAARGLDIAALPHVVCYDFPPTLEQYVHRVGRTGRAARAGHALSFFPRTLAPLAPDLVRLLKAHNQRVDPYLQQVSSWAAFWLTEVPGVWAAARRPREGLGLTSPPPRVSPTCSWRTRRRWPSTGWRRGRGRKGRARSRRSRRSGAAGRAAGWTPSTRQCGRRGCSEAALRTHGPACGDRRRTVLATLYRTRFPFLGDPAFSSPPPSPPPRRPCTARSGRPSPPSVPCTAPAAALSLARAPRSR